MLPYLSLATFIDWGEVELNKNIGDHRNLAGWGVGVQYARPNDYYLRVDYARKLNGEVYQSEENDKSCQTEISYRRSVAQLCSCLITAAAAGFALRIGAYAVSAA